MLSGGFKLVQDWGYFECIPHQGKKQKTKTKTLPP